MDNKSFEMLSGLKLKNLRPVKLSEVEDPRLLAVKNSRTKTEYCWMMSSSFPLFLLEKERLATITYLDADIYFFRSPTAIFEEFGNNSIMLIPHWYPIANHPKERKSGIYNVGMMIFKNDDNGLRSLRWWKDRVIEWCYNRYEDGKYGDQLYLNDWPQRFGGVHILKNRGANVAPWNISGYFIFKKSDEFWIEVKETTEKFPLIFYHYHGLKTYLGGKNQTVAYPVTVLESQVYNKYLEALNRAGRLIRQFDPGWNYGHEPKISFFKKIKQVAFKFLNI